MDLAKNIFSTRLFRNIDELITLRGAGKKQGRKASEKDLKLIKNGAILSINGRIEWVGSSNRIPLTCLRLLKGKNFQEVSLKGYSVLPAFVESHTHLIFAGNRTDEFELKNQGKTYQEIATAGGGIHSTVKATRSASIKSLLAPAQKRVDQFVRQGVSTLEIKSGYGLDLKTEIKMLNTIKSLSGPRFISTFLGPHAIPKKLTSQQYLNLIVTEWLPQIARKGLAQRVDIFVEQGYFSVKQAETYYKAAKKLRLPFVGHCDQLNRTGGGRMAALLGAQSVDHLVKINSKDIDVLAKSKSTCVLLPSADFYMQCPYPPARALIDKGARVALATDFNPGTSPTQDLSFIGVLARLNMKMTLPEVIVAYTLGGAYALGLQDHLGTLEKSKFCDFIAFEGAWDELFYQVGHHPVRQTWSRGEKLTSPDLI